MSIKDRWAACLLLLSLVHFPVAAKDASPRQERFHTSLDLVAFQALTRPSLGGKGHVDAVLSGDTLVISGSFEDLPSPILRGKLYSGLAVGVPGEPVLALVTSKGKAGSISGQFKLDPSLSAALRGGRLYVQIDTEAAPNGSIWGWLLPVTEKSSGGGGQR